MWKVATYLQQHVLTYKSHATALSPILHTHYVSKGSYTLGFTQPKKFQSCTCLLFLWPPTVYFWRLFRIFCICLFSSIRCSHHLPAIFGSSWGCFVLVCLCHQFSSSRHCLYTALHVFTVVKLVWILFDLNEFISTRPQCIAIVIIPWVFGLAFRLSEWPLHMC